MKGMTTLRVVSCSGFIDPDLPALPKCPFFNPDTDMCSLNDDAIGNPRQIPITTIPDDCLLRNYVIVVRTDVLNQTKMEI
jgi:hypothetical protein